MKFLLQNFLQIQTDLKSLQIKFLPRKLTWINFFILNFTHCSLTKISQIMVENFRELDWNDTFHYFDYHHIGAMFIRRRFPLTLWLWRINFEFYEGPAQPWPTPVHWKAPPTPPPQPPPPYLQPWWKPGPSIPVPRPNFSCIGKAEGFYYRGPCVPEFYVCFGWVHLLE